MLLSQPTQHSFPRGYKTLDKYIRKITHDRAHLDATGRCRLRYQRISVHIRVLPEQDLVIFKCFTNFVPDPSSGMVMPLYYHLLNQNDTPATGEAYFTLVPGEEVGMPRDVISMETRSPLSGMSFEMFRRCLASVALASDQYIEQLEDEFFAPPVP